MGDASDSQEQPVLESAELEMKKKRLLEELESALAPKDAGVKTVTALPASLALGIEVIDETALLDSVVKNGGPRQQPSSRRRGGPKNNNSNIGHGLRKIEERPKLKSTLKNGNNKYSRKELEALRFVNLTQQRKFWKAIHAAFQSTVASEYDTLASTPLPHNKPILSAVYCESRDGELQHMGSSENITSHSSTTEDGASIVEECVEDDDSDDDYASIQRPAFLVDGEPNFDSGPPEDGWEYLRRVRWEADHIPKVKIAKLDRGKFNQEQSPYMPKIPDIAKCPDHLLPLKQWEDVFLAEFSTLRTNLSCLDGNLGVHHSQLVGNDCGEFSGVMNKDVLLGKTNNASANLTAEDKDRTVSPENTESKTSVDKTSSSSPSSPLLSAILAMDSVTRVKTLLKRIRLLEAADTVTRDDCMWLFALCATVDTPLYADTCAALRSLLRRCASIRAGKVALDDEVVMLNILATISGRYFGQSEN
ncbi:gem-associated protein 2-like [Vigna unguiculata]|uniref:Survival of motor neuron protein-interacting protein 1 n=1 Tax=Vigna unguiculata TaxID=3917 RepID=A0A4D6MW46_VIGUN|nr:gem-associated protein 2-like [Vigna unguiculata]QCE05696.1 survival of motor neuron protein-interacting protein 1 [Vigna unguiculata]